MQRAARFVIRPAGLTELIRLLQGAGYRTLGPRMRDGRVIGIGEIDGVHDLPGGVGDEQEPSSYRVTKRNDGAYFSAAAPSDTWKKYLFPAVLPLVRSVGSGADITLSQPDQPPGKQAFIGIRGCDVAAILIQDEVFLHRDYPDPHYAARRMDLFLVAVDCAVPAQTCFCPSMGTGPAVGAKADLVLTELLDEHRFVVAAHTDRGRQIAGQLEGEPISPVDIEAMEDQHRAAEESITRHVDTQDLPGILAGAANHPRWDGVAERCLSCANCTLACPTCFCFDVTDDTDLVAGSADRVRRWGSCFERSHSYLHGGAVRLSPKSRYRQWLTHKLGTWWEQFGTSGCTGCGRCITWCPTGIDITEEVAALREEPS